MTPTRAPTRLVVFVAALASAGVACRAATDAAAGQIAITTDRSVYHSDSGDVVHYRLVNRGPDAVYTWLPSTYVSVQQQRGLAWVDLGSFWYGTLAVVPFVRAVGAGDSLPGIPLSTLNPHLGGSGRYRFVYTVYRDRAAQQLLPLDARVSNVFDIVYGGFLRW
jgi:hypothetical protein